MSVETLMTQTCSILRDSGTTTDANGHTVANFQAIAEDVPCRIWRLKATEVITDKGVVVSEHGAALPYGQDVTAADRVLCDGITYEVKHVEANPGQQQSHCQAGLKAVT